MSNPTQYKRTWGLRFSLVDAVTICVILGAAALLWRLDSPLAWMLLITGGHFFLFCNVFRIIRHREITWAGLFLLNIALWGWFDRLAWYPVMLSQLPVTVALILLEMRSLNYHGVFANRINHRLDEYLNGTS